MSDSDIKQDGERASKCMTDGMYSYTMRQIPHALGIMVREGVRPAACHHAGTLYDWSAPHTRAVNIGA